MHNNREGFMTKECPHCKITKSIDSFSKDKNRSEGIASWCKSCCSEDQRARYRRDPKKVLTANKVWREENPSNRLKNHLKQYGLTIENFDSLRKQQDYSCAICEIPENKLKSRLHVDHCHKTNKVRGLLCGNCNTALGLLKENRNIILRLLEYNDDKGRVTLLAL